MTRTESNNQRSGLGKRRIEPSRPPIEWPVRKQSSTGDDRAAAYARQQVQRSYNSPVNHAKTIDTQTVSQQAANTMRDQPYDWQKYHSAWQQYYQQYFHRYYTNWIQQQHPRPNVDITPDKQHVSEARTYTDNTNPSDDQRNTARELRHKLRKTVRSRAQKVQASSHFKPLLAAASVAIIFLFLNYNQIIFGAVRQYITPGGIVTDPVIVEPSARSVVGPEPRLIIPKIGLEAPVIYDEPRVDESSYQKALDRGVVRLGNTPDPGTRGNTVIGGHSSNNVFNTGGWKYAFVNLKRLKVGDIFYLNFEGKRYTYRVTTAGKIVKPTDVSVLRQTKNPTVTLFTCDPPGTNINRLIVHAEQIDPNPSEAKSSTNKITDNNEANPLPSVAPSLWDRLFQRN